MFQNLESFLQRHISVCQINQIQLSEINHASPFHILIIVHWLLFHFFRIGVISICQFLLIYDKTLARPLTLPSAKVAFSHYRLKSLNNVRNCYNSLHQICSFLYTPGQFTRLLTRILLHENMDYIDCIN